MKIRIKDYMERSDDNQYCMVCQEKIKLGEYGLCVTDSPPVTNNKSNRKIHYDLICKTCLVEALNVIDSEFLSKKAKGLLVVKEL